MAQKSRNTVTAEDTLKAKVTVNKSGRRKFLRGAGYLGLGGVVGVGSAPAQAGMFDSLLSVIKKLLQAAVVGIALFYAWRYLANVSESVKSWLEKQLENDDKNNQDEIIVQAKYADYVNMGEHVIANAEIMADYDPPDDACDMKSMGRLSDASTKRSVELQSSLAREISELPGKNREKVGGKTVQEVKVDAFTRSARTIMAQMDVLIGRKGLTLEEKKIAMDALQLLTGVTSDTENPVKPDSMHLHAVKHQARNALSQLVSRRIKSEDFIDTFIGAQTDDQARALAEEIAFDGLSHVDMLVYEANRYSLTPWNIASLSAKPKPTPLYKKLLVVRAAGNAFQEEYLRLKKQRQRMTAASLAVTSREVT
ncbi:hypothetical protein [Alteromonas antoniana]|uniref:hypothetical protein n=1 Tax=Alteromonas antoniana TaxID=2803813 RepID=UPI001C450433|nr:hypothetical protein [Alteromonas antoniana]